MSEKRIGIIMHGVTGRMGMNQHLIRSILEIRKQGGVALKDGTRVMPDPLLGGRNAAKVEALAKQHGLERWSADLDRAFFPGIFERIVEDIYDALRNQRTIHRNGGQPGLD